MSNQRTFDDAPQIVSPNESHMALLFLLDVSGSMSGAPITSLNESINKFKEQVCQDARTTQILDVAIVTFNHETQVVMPFTPVAYMEPVALTASGGTEIAPAVETAINMAMLQLFLSRFVSWKTEDISSFSRLVLKGMTPKRCISCAVKRS